MKPLINELPGSSKTFFKSSYGNNHIIKEFPTSSDNPKLKSEFIYFGISENLQMMVNVKAHLNFILLLQFFVDGLPLFKSSKVQFWPLLGRIVTVNNLYVPFIIACICGQEKPSSSALYFDEFVTEFNTLMSKGLLIDGFKFQIRSMCFLGDPARSFAKNVINHGGFFACEKCPVKGITFMNMSISCY